MCDKEKLNAVSSPSNSAQSGQWSISESNFAILSKSSMEHILVQCIEIHSTLLFRSPSRTLVRTQILSIEFDVKKQRTRKKNEKFTSMGTFRELDIFHISDTKKNNPAPASQFHRSTKRKRNISPVSQHTPKSKNTNSPTPSTPNPAPSTPFNVVFPQLPSSQF